MLLLVSGFFGFNSYLLPALQSASYFQAKDVVSENIVSAETEPSVSIKDPISKTDELLSFAIKQKISSYPSSQKWSVYAYELGSDSTVKINENQDYDAASLYKIFLLEALEKKVSFGDWRKTYVSGKSLSQCAELMLQVSDDPCSEDLAEYLGWDYIDEFNKESGFENTSLAGLKGRTTTASDVGDLFVRLKKGHALSDSARRYVFDTLYQQSYSKGLASGCVDCRAAAKAGELSNVSHDAGVITHGSKSYVLVIMSDGGNFEQISELTSIVDARFSKAD